MSTKRKRLIRSTGGNITAFTFLILVGVFMVLPLVYAIVSSLKPFEELFIFPPRFFVRRPTLENFADLFILSSNMWVPFSRYIFNSVFVSITATVLHVIFASAAAYPLAKHEFPGKNAINGIIVTTLLFTGTVTAIPQYIILSKLGMVNTYFALIAPAIGSSMGLFLMRQFMLGVPVPMIESARIDGSSEYRTFWSIVMPNVKPAWLTLAILAFQGVWNNNPTTFIYDEQLKMLPTVLSQIATAGIARVGAGMAASILLMMPPLLAFILIQANVIETMAHAGLKE